MIRSRDRREAESFSRYAIRDKVVERWYGAISHNHWNVDPEFHAIPLRLSHSPNTTRTNELTESACLRILVPTDELAPSLAVYASYH